MKMNNVKYTYLIGWSYLNKYYYGVRIKDGIENPNDDLWIVYKTSSKIVKEIYKEYGDPDVIQVRKIFSTKESALKWELKVLRRLDVVNNPKFINMHVIQNNGLAVNSSPKVKDKIKKTNLERYGESHTLNLEHVKTARELAILTKYGVSNPVYSEEFQNQQKERMKDPKHIEKISNGVKRAWVNYDFSVRNEKTQQTNFKKYGVSCSMNTPELIKERQSYVLNCPYNCQKQGGQISREKKSEYPLLRHWRLCGFISHMRAKHGMDKQTARNLFEKFKQDIKSVQENKHLDITLEMAGLA